MDHLVFSKIKKTCPQDPITVNRLFVSAYIHKNCWIERVEMGSFLDKYLIRDLSDTALKLCVSLLEKHNCNFSLEELIELFECVLSPQEKIVNGAVYTPKYIRTYLLTQLFDQTSNLGECKLADISCGCGAFLLSAAELIHLTTGKKYSEIISQNLFGFDIADYALERTKILLSLLLLRESEPTTVNFNLYQGDSLRYPFKKRFPKGFDIIVGNPPYVCSRKLTESTRKNIRKWSTCQVGHPDLYVPFFQIALENLSSNGLGAYITVNSFFKSLNGTNLREYFQRLQTRLDIIDFGYHPIFKDKLVYTCLCFFSNARRDHIRYRKTEPSKLFQASEVQIVAYESLDSNKGWNLHQHELMSIFESFPHKLGEVCTSRHGIATLKNSVYIFSPVAENDGYYFFEKSGKQIAIEKGICRDIINSNKFIPNIEISKQVEKIIFPYHTEHNNVINLMDEGELKALYPKTYRYLVSQRISLSERDKGKVNNYPAWFAFGRTQSLRVNSFKLFYPKIASKQIRCCISEDCDLLFYNGQAFLSANRLELEFIKRILESSLFSLYVTMTSKPYSSGYYSLNGTYIKNFSIPEEVLKQKEWIVKQSQSKVDEFLKKVVISYLEPAQTQKLLNLLKA